jgi:hypothetical protein
MKKEAITAKQVQVVKPADKRFEVPAGPPVGLYLVVHPSGKKSWALRYRWHGMTRKLTFPESYPELGLAAARGEAVEAHRSGSRNGPCGREGRRGAGAREGR